jgi:hypothetical protein
MHNGFTDLVYWQDSYWVSYRKGSKHASIDGEACLAVSTNRERFREVAHVKVPGDTRDPKIIPVDAGRLAMYFPTWIGGFKKRNLQQYVTFSNDGWNWEEPQPIYDPHWWLWRITKYDNRYYCGAYSSLGKTPGKPESHVVDFLVSDDLLHWEKLSRVEGMSAVESAVHFREDGAAWMISRDSGRGAPAVLSISQPPYSAWENQSLEYMIHSPAMLEHDGAVYVAGRRNALHDGPHFPFLNENPSGYVSSVGIWKLDGKSLQPIMYIPATGDSGYPGFIKDPKGRICLTYYSGHAYRMGVLPNRFRQSPDEPERWERVEQSDVYFAELEL